MVQLWHPALAGADEVHVWRQLLLDRQLAQPVKQAFREVYVLTPAEVETGDHSNRFAGHVFRQVQARALMKVRGWVPTRLDAWDLPGFEPGVARKVYERVGTGWPSGIRAEFFFDPMHVVIGETHPYVRSGQIRFCDAGTGDTLPLERVPPTVFTEAMRDVDLFIGVATIGADPEWLERDGGHRFGDDYWREWGFGTLNAAAEVRRMILEQLIPRLAIADQCTLEARFLVVRGDLRTYKIHLGSGNILMSPNGQYLCITAARDARAGKVFLPFDDDMVLSMILSKAFLLAADAKITDPSISR